MNHPKFDNNEFEAVTMERPTVWLLKDGEPLPNENKGQQLRTGNLAQALLELGVSVTWFVSSFNHGQKTHRSSETKLVSLAPNFTLAILKGPGYSKNASFRRLIHQTVTAKEFSRFSSSLAPPQLIVSAYPTPELNEAARIYAQKYNIPYVVDVRDPWPDLFPTKLHTIALKIWYRKLLRKSLAQANSIVSMSERMLRWAVGYSGRPRQPNDAVFHLGCRFGTHREPLRHAFQFTAEAPMQCIFYAMFGKLHRGDVIIEAAIKLHQLGEKRIKFVFIGDGELRGKWQQQAAGLSNIEFKGWLGRQEAEAELIRAHVGLIAISDQVGDFWFGNKFFEYLGAGLAIINNTTSELRQLIEQSGLGDNFEAYNSTQLTELLLQYMQRPEVLLATMRNSANYFEQYFSAGPLYERYARHVLRVANVAVPELESNSVNYCC